ncbi:MAG: hypothetical protein IKV86_05410 [Clostridia bacterium]|nr:hypothetical protein [Clostridia bacterium]
MESNKEKANNLLIKQIEENHINLLKRQNEAINDLFDEFEFMFSIIKLDLEKKCSLQTMRYMLMIDVFLNELKNVFYNYKEDEDEEDMDI